MGQFRHHHSGKTRTMALFWLRTSYHAQRYMFQRYMLRSLLTQSFNIVNTPIILLFSKKWVPGFAAEDNTDKILYEKLGSVEVLPTAYFNSQPLIMHAYFKYHPETKC